jgi:hypothetical protein
MIEAVGFQTVFSVKRCSSRGCRARTFVESEEGMLWRCLD